MIHVKRLSFSITKHLQNKSVFSCLEGWGILEENKIVPYKNLSFNLNVYYSTEVELQSKTKNYILIYLVSICSSSENMHFQNTSTSNKPC